MLVAGQISIELAANIARLQRDMDRANQLVSNATAGIERAANAAKAALGGIAAGMGGRELVSMIDQYAKFTAQLKLATDSQREYAQAYGDVKRIAKDSQQELGATGVLYARIANGTRELGVEQARIAAITETVNLALKVSGASANESASAQLQLSQAFASGALRGEEFNAVNEAAPRLMKALADGIGVPVGALKKMAEEGQITSGIMADVLPRALSNLRQEAKQVQTIAGAFSELKNNALEFVGVQSQANGVVSTMTGAIGLLANNLTTVAGAALTLTAVKMANWLSAAGARAIEAAAAQRALVASNLATAQANATATASASLLANARLAEVRAATLAATGNVQLALTANGLIPAQARATAAAAAHTAAMGALTVAQRAASTSAMALNATLTVFGGPIGAIITVLGLAATAWSIWGNKAEEANNKALQSTEETTPEMIARLDKQIEKLKERNALAATEPRIKALGEISEADQAGLARAKAALDAVRAGTGEWANQSVTMRQLAEIDILADYETALKRVQQVQDQVTIAANRTRDQRLAEWYAQNGSNAQKLAAELDKLKKEFGSIPPEMEKIVRAKYADKGAAAAIKQEVAAYQNLMTSIREKIAANQLELSGYDKLSESQRMTIKLDAAIGTGKNKLNAEHVKEARSLIERVEAQEELLEAQQRAAKAAEVYAKNDSDHYDKLRAGTAAIDERIVQMQREVDLYGMTASAAVEAEKAKLEAKLAAGPATYAELIALDQQIEKLEKLAELTRKKETLDAEKKENEERLAAQKQLWGDIERTAHDTFISIFDSGKSAFDRLKDALKNGLYELLYQMTVKKWVINLQASSTGGSLAQAITSSGSGGSSIFGTASNLFEVGKSIFGGFKTGLSSYLGQGVSYVGNAVGSNAMFSFGQGMQGFGAGGIGSGISGGAASAGSSFASALPIAGWIAAGMMANNKFYDQGWRMDGQASDITKSQLDSMWKGNGLAPITAIMTASMGTFDKLLTGLGLDGKTASMLSGSALWTRAFGRKAPSVEAQGIQGTVSSSGFDGQAYAEMLEKGGWFRSDKRYTQTAALGADQDKNLDATVKAMIDAAKGFASTLGIEASVIEGYNKQIKLELGKDEKANQEAIAKMFGEIGDELSLRLVPNLSSFAKAGEATSATLQRLVTDYATVDEALTAIGMQFGAVGVQSLSARERLIEASGGLEAFAANTAGFQQNFLTEAERLAPVMKSVTEQLASMGLSSVDTREEFKSVVLGLDLTTEAGAKQYGELMKMQAAFALVYPEMQSTADAAKAAAEALAQTNKGYQDQIDELLRARMSPQEQRAADIAGMDASTVLLYDRVAALKEEAAALEALKERSAAVASERLGLQNELDDLTLSAAEKLRKQRDALDESNRALFDQVQAATAARDAFTKLQQTLSSIAGARAGIADDIFGAQLGGKDLAGKIAQIKAAEDSLWSKVGTDASSVDVLAKIKALAMQRIGFEDQLQDEAIAKLKEQYDLRKTALTDELAAMTKMRDYAANLRQFADGLKLGSLSALSPAAQLAEAEKQYRKTLGLAQGGDSLAQGNLQSIAQSYLELSKQFFGSTTSYASTFAGVIADIEKFTAPSESEFASVQQQISAVNDMSSSLGKTVRDTSARQVEVLTKIDGALQKAQESTEAQLRQAAAANTALVGELQKANSKLAAVEERLARMEATA